MNMTVMHNNNEYWMTSLPEEVRNISLINIAIPGTHNSMTYDITSEIAPDADKSTRRLNYIFPCFVQRWAKTQSSSIQEQLILGVRYFDLRVCQKDDRLYYTHGLLCSMEISEPLVQIMQFLDSHPREIVVIDFQHFYDMTPMLHKRLHSIILESLGERLYSTSDGSLFNCTLNRCASLQKQIVLIYRRCPIMLPIEFWPSNTWPTPWPNCASSKELEKFLQDALLSRNAALGYVSQCVLTPSARYITLRFFSSLRRTAKKVDKKLKPWIINQSPGPFEGKAKPKVNVFIADFVNLKDGEFCNLVIRLNEKLYAVQKETIINDTR